MNRRILEIINIFDERFTDENTLFSIDVIEELLFEGYLQHEIEEAMSWIETYQTAKLELSDFKITETFSGITMSEGAYHYLTNLLNKNVISETIFDEILTYCLFNANDDIDLEKAFKYYIFLHHLSNRWGKEAKANYLAYALKKDC